MRTINGAQRTNSFQFWLTLAVILAMLHFYSTEVTAEGTTTIISISSAGVQGNDLSGGASISADGRYVAFDSYAINLVAGDTNGTRDIFVRDRQTGETTRVSVSTGGMQGDSWSADPSISADGRFVAFISYATNFAGGWYTDTNETMDVFVHDRQTGETSRVSVSTAGVQGNYSSGAPSISADGRYVAFDSSATNLVAGDTNGRTDVFVHDRQTGVTTRVSVSTEGVQANGGSNQEGSPPRMSSDGRYVAFDSDASNLAAGDTNETADVFVHDRQTAQTTRVSVSTAGVQGNSRSEYPNISADGRYVAFPSEATNLVAGDTNARTDVFVHDRQTGETTRVSVSTAGVQGNNDSWIPSISADGRYMAFHSDSTNLVAGDTNGFGDIFVHDRQTGETTRVSVSTAGGQGNASSSIPSISADGRYVAFGSSATNLVTGDTNGETDVFVHDRGTGQPPTPPPTEQTSNIVPWMQLLLF